MPVGSDCCMSPHFAYEAKMSCHTSWFMTLPAGSMSNDQLAAAIN
jgi:hypothetical protein